MSNCQPILGPNGGQTKGGLPTLHGFCGYRLTDGTVVTSGQGMQVMIHRQVSQY